MKPLDPTLFSSRELQELVRRMIVANQVKNHTLTATYGGIKLKWETELAEDRRSVICQMIGPGWTIHTVMEQNELARLEIEDLFFEGNRKRFETDIIYLKMAIAS